MDKSGGDSVFHLRHSETESVALFISLDGYRPRKAALGKGRWTDSPPGSEAFSHFYRIDGENDIPDCHHREKDDFGQENCSLFRYGNPAPRRTFIARNQMAH